MAVLPEWIRKNSVPDANGCLLWTGASGRQGYAKYAGQEASRRAYTEVVGPIPDGLELDHLCRITSCVNPWHLEPVTREENIRRRTVLVTHCKNGHEFDLLNTYIRPTGNRQCRRCNRAAVAKYKYLAQRRAS